MTIVEAMEKGLTKIRKSIWDSPVCRLELQKMDNGKFGPWATLVDPPTQKVLGTGPQDILLMGLSREEDDWEEYTVPENYTHMDSAGRPIGFAAKVLFRGKEYTIKEFIEGEGNFGSAKIVFEEEVHTDEPACECNVDVIE